MYSCLTNIAHMLIYFSNLTNQENWFDQFLKYSTSSLWTAMPKGNNKNCLIKVTPRWYINMFKQIKMPFSFAETLHYSQFFSSYQKIPSGLVDFSIAQHVGLILGPFRNPLFPSSTPTTTTPLPNRINAHYSRDRG